ncbi:LLM class F420-dependent oxidoreductase [Hamadaea tsunoensis]|uniref:LLM class F420-dependent oxidoreductase n=1 Tax=Hamadaea tsunoensis TaxID=53368 RepID=UPI0004826F13|nr:LLM class F420-dependent oxidoreductase [Hamadaea tsunoensis]
MRLAVFIEPQFGATYADQLAIARHAEQLGFDAFFRSDHFLTMGSFPAVSGDGQPGPTESWVTLAALAVQTERIRLGTLLSSATFRLPGVLAMTVAQVDQMSGGRVELGLGAGWFEAEHTAYGIPFPPVRERFDRLEEQLEIITGLWAASGTYEFHGKHYEIADSPALPKPVQSPRPPVIVGGAGPRRTPDLAARFADEFNVPFRPLAETAAVYDKVREACARYGRTELPVFSAAQTIACGRTDAEARRRAEAIGQQPPLFGTPAQVAEQIAAFAALGAQRLFLQVLDIHDLDHLDVVMSEVAPRL